MHARPVAGDFLSFMKVGARVQTPWMDKVVIAATSTNRSVATRIAGKSANLNAERISITCALPAVPGHHITHLVIVSVCNPFRFFNGPKSGAETAQQEP